MCVALGAATLQKQIDGRIQKDVGLKKHNKTECKTYGKNRSLRLQGYDYSTTTAYFLTICSAEKREFFSDWEFAKKVITCLKDCSDRCEYKMLAYCLMPDHLHLLVCPTEGARPVPKYIQTFKSLSTRIFWESHGKGKLWQRGFYDHIVRKNEDLVEIAKYILANPMRKRLSDDPEEYPFSWITDDFCVV
jgi:putative transposase